MDDYFEIPVFYNEKKIHFTARLLNFGYVHKFEVDVFGQVFFFEQDDCGEYRAVIDAGNMDEAKKINVDLLKAIAASIEIILK